MRDLTIIVAVALGSLALGFIATVGCASKRASQSNPVNGPVRVLSEAAQ